MKKPVLVIMAAGMGSRYGGLKQIDPVDEQGHIIMDFSLYDAKEAGFEKVVFIIKKENEEAFRAGVGERIEKEMEVSYVFQELSNLPEGYQVPEGRVKPFGTGHAVMSCVGTVDGPFAVINADDYYGKHAFQMLYDYLTTHEDDEQCYHYVMVGYILKNTLTENGFVSRGICQVDDKGCLAGITERTRIEKRGEKAVYSEDGGEIWEELSPESTVSMNMFGFTESMLRELQARFTDFLEKNLEKNPMKCEYFLPSVVEELLEEKKAEVQVLRSSDRWYGVTYQEDKAAVVDAIRKMKEEGLYPKRLWGTAKKDLGSVLVAGGAGYIGSHTCVELLEKGYDVVVADNLCNSSEIALERVQKITGKSLKFYKADLRDRERMEEIFEKESIDTVINFAGLKAVGESVEKPWEYYDNNITGTLVLCDVMRKHGCKKMIFSSSATVYGNPAEIPITEKCPKGEITNPYGQTKGMLEQILQDLYVGDPEWNIMLLRYFNPIGAHISGLIGEDPKGIPNNLVPYIAKVAVGQLEKLGVFGDDYPTPDGTGVRDYIHVTDLAAGHVKAIEKMQDGSGVRVYNLGTGVGYSVLDVVKAYERACGKKIPYEIKPRRAGDIAECYCDATKAREELGWTAKKNLEDMCADSWRWQSMNPNGYRTEKD